MKSKPVSELLTSTEAAAALGIHPNTLKRMPGLPFVRIGTRGDRRYRRADLDKYLEVNTANYSWSRNADNR